MSANVIDIDFTDIVNNTPEVNTDGYFVELMKSMNAYIKEEYSNGRITGTDYATVYLGSLQFALQEASNFALQRTLQNQQAELIETQKRLTEAQIVGEGLQQTELVETQRAYQNQQTELVEAQQRLTEAKIISEGKQQLVIDNQAALYDAQALAFKYRHKKDMAKLRLDAWTIISTGSNVYATDASTVVFGEVVSTAITNADWA
jgi:hypothetical protein